MISSFEHNDRGDAVRILFIGLGDSSHTHSWIDLLEQAPFNVRLFCTSKERPPASWGVKTYVWERNHADSSANRRSIYEERKLRRTLHRAAARARGREWRADWLLNDRLLEVLKGWRPQIVHTLGLDAGRFYLAVRHRLGQTAPRWVLQTRGGSDLQWTHLDPKQRIEIAAVLKGCDQLLSDNTVNFSIARDLGVSEGQISRIGPVPGTGGIDVESIARSWERPPAQRRAVLWPKAYECPWSKSLPVFEALKLSWEKIQPCKVQLLAACGESRMYYRTLPEQIRNRIELHDRVPRDQALKLMTEARVVLAPSLVDGTPNSMFEAMAAGALPIVSPIESICTVAENERNVLFARNLYPEEIAAALVRAMNDDALVQATAEHNLDLVRRVANRDEVRQRVIGLYQQLAGSDN